ncbi:MAG: hypothetical protein HYU59_00330 [Magnetospirillum gryphiswaldense]|uniref:hypothetical protein n=1 Tax=Magnetospirillum sp. 64-120 TaxID=1895778 RepID=UPI00092847D5|nr:hypothetical protein [Magnetospirillum sp. 64-120]MBI2239227.1 hypothetical protein [Magnetospirillum gryphiswaldense]OJX77482.1 MAG: hypothetical protein BGO92_10480 [Magnetospirillum sp. 64-120]
MRTFTSLLGAFALVLLLACGDARAQGFLTAYEDLPLAPGLTEVAGSGLSFDTPGGRIVEAYARGAGKAADILAFYAATLPQLGWTKAGPAEFRRDDETLKLAIETQGRDVVVHFTIAPE